MKTPFISAKTKVISLSIAGALLIYALCGFFLIPALLSDQIPKLAQEKLNREIQIDNIDFNPFSLELSVQDIQVKNPDNSPFFNASLLYVNVGVLSSITHLSLYIDKILLQQPDFSITRDNQGSFNFSDLLKQEPQETDTPPEQNSLFPVHISHTIIAEGRLNWDDNYYSKPQHEAIFPLNLNISNLTTITDTQSQLGVKIQIASGGEFEWNGQLQLSPLKSTGKIKLDKVEFSRVWALFLQDFVNFELLDGHERIAADYILTDTKGGIQLQISNAYIDIHNFKLSAKNGKEGESVISIPDFSVSGISLDLLNKQIDISDISAKDANFKAWLNSDGNINYQSLFANQTSTETASEPQQKTDTDASKAWKMSIKHLAFNNFSLQFDDNSLKGSPAHVNLNAINLETSDLSNDLDQNVPFKLGLTVNEQGSLKLQGQAALQPFSTELQLNAEKIAINPFQPYISEFVKLDIISGQFNAKTNISLLQQANKEIKIKLQGDSQINNFVSRDQTSNKDLLNWKQLSLNKINIDLAENSFLIDTVKIKQPYSRVLIRKDKSVNLNDIVVDTTGQKSASTTVKKTSRKEKKKTSFKINHIELTEGKSDFSDLSLILPFSAPINNLKGTVKNIASDKNAVAKVKLNGRVGKLAPVNIKGEISPYHGNSEFELDFKNMSLPLMTPYMADFAGRKIEKGKMSLGLKYKIKGQQLTASNNLLIDQLVLGEEVKNPDATSLPLDLAIALLQDADGKIVLDVPITGSLDDPEFSVANLVIKALVNVITKVVTSPFYAISSLIEGDEDPGKVYFLAGAETLEEKQITKLEGLVKALSNRPALNLEIKGSSFSKLDWPFMQNKALDQQIKQNLADELNKGNKKKVLAENLALSEEDYNRLLTDLFIQKHPELADRSLFGTPRLIDPKAGDFYQVAKTKLASSILPDPKLLHKLAVSRSQSIAEYLVKKGISRERIFLLDAIVDPDTANDEIATTLNLTVN